MEGTKTGRLRQGVVSVTVLMVHVSFIAVAIRTRYSQPPVRDVVSTWIVLPTDPFPKTSNPHPLTHAPASLINPTRIELPNTESLATLPTDPGKAIDWTVEAARAAAALSNAPKPRELGSFPRADTQEMPVHPTPAHHAGEQYRDLYGNTVVWVSDRCYVVSERAALGMPGVLAQSRPTHTVCVDPRAPEGELFKDLPAYKKYHSK